MLLTGSMTPQLVLSPNCLDPFTGTAATAFSVTTSEDESLSNGFIAFNNTIEIDISKINGTEWFKPLPGGDYGGIIDLCLEAAVYLSLNGVNEKMNMLHTNVTITVEMDANFEVIGIDADRKDPTTTPEGGLGVDYSDYVETPYQCDSAFPDTPLVEPFPTYNQGDTLVFCVRGTDEDVADVSSIKSIVASQAGGNSSPFFYVVDGIPVDSEVAAVQCNQGSTGNVCVAEIMLLGRFFTDDNPGDLTLSGGVSLDFVTTSRRLDASLKLLEQESPSRHAQDEQIEGFSLKGIKLGKSGDESSSFSYGTLLSTLMTGAIGAVASMLLVFQKFSAHQNLLWLLVKFLGRNVSIHDIQ